MPRPQYHPLVQKSMRDLAGIILPAFQRESIDEHVQQILDEDDAVHRLVRSHPEYKRTLEHVARTTYDEHYYYIATAKVIDTADRVLGALGVLAEFFPGIGTALRYGENTLELLPKAAYAIWYARGTGDHAAIGYFAGAELLSFTPFAGAFFDMANIYLNRSRETYRATVCQRFLERVGQFSTTRELGYARTDEMRELPILDAEIVEAPHNGQSTQQTTQQTTTSVEEQDPIARGIASIRLLPVSSNERK